jgi:hypothetical protein
MTMDTQQLDCLTNAEFMTLISEPQYTALISLMGPLSIDTIRHILTFIPISVDLSKRTVRRLTTAIKECNVDAFKFIYDHEYMNHFICNWFEYDELLDDCVWNFYPICECAKCEPIKIHRQLYVQPCTCLNGKRYLAFLTAYNTTYDFIINPTKKSIVKYRQMLDYIIESGPVIVDHISVELKIF